MHADIIQEKNLTQITFSQISFKYSFIHPHNNCAKMIDKVLPSNVHTVKYK